ncbi:MAG: hypothetical protein K6G64_07335 [Eubacterium sp.]|nr:hypothetical protein [Eubacterium sp.]
MNERQENMKKQSGTAENERRRFTKISKKSIACLLSVVLLMGSVFSGCTNLLYTKPYKPGSVKDNMYENKFFHVRFQCPEGYTMTFSEVPQDEANDMIKGNLGGNGSFQELKVESTSNGNYMYVTIVRGKVDVTSSSGRERIEEMAQQMVSSVPGVGYDLGEPYQDTLGGENFDALDFEINVQGYTARSNFYVKYQNGYSMFIMFYGFEDYFGELFEGFVPYEES